MADYTVTNPDGRVVVQPFGSEALGPILAIGQSSADAAAASALKAGVFELSAEQQAAIAAAKAMIAQQAANDGGNYLAAIRQITNGSPTTQQLPLEATSRTILAGFTGMVAGRQAYLGEPGREGMFRWATGDQSAKVGADPLQGVYVAPASDPTGASGAWFRIVINPIRPEWWGAQGDGATYDGDSFTALSAFVTANGGGVIELRPVIYRVGFQYQSGTYYLYGGNVFDLHFAGAVVIRGNGAILKYRDGMKYGTFDPATGNPYPSKAPYYDNGQRRADYGHGIQAWGLTSLTISNLTFDLNVQKAQIGGEWGDLGRQCDAYGYFIRDCLNVWLHDVHVVNSPLDGGSVANYTLAADGSSPPRPILLTNCSTDTVARNGFSLLGTNQFFAINCSFNNSGSAPNDVFGAFGTAPGSGVDVEAEGAPCRNVRFEKCRFGTATGNTFVADSGDTQGITFHECEFNGIFWTSKPYTRLYNCVLNGVVRKAAGGAKSVAGGTLFQDCVINGNVIGDLCVDTQGSGPLELVRTRINLIHGSANLRGAWLTDCSIVSLIGTGELADGSRLLYLEGAITKNLTIDSDPTAANQPPNGYYVPIILSNSPVVGNAVTSGKVFWGYNTPSFQGELWTVTSQHAAFTNSGTAVSTEKVKVSLAFAQLGDRIEARYSGTADGVLWTAVVNAANSIELNLLYFPGGSLGAGTFSFRVYKNGQ